jgi:hypothetical protein
MPIISFSIGATGEVDRGVLTETVGSRIGRYRLLEQIGPKSSPKLPTKFTKPAKDRKKGKPRVLSSL